MRSLAGRNRVGRILWGCRLDGGGKGEDVQKAGLDSLYEFSSMFCRHLWMEWSGVCPI